MADKPKKELGGARNLSTGVKVGIVIIAVIMALGMMLPSLSSIFASGSSKADEQSESSEQTDEQTSESTDEGADDQNADDESKDDKEKEDDKLKDVPDNESLKSLATTNLETIEPYQKRLKEDKNDLAALLNMGKTYMSWGYSAKYSSTTDEEQEYSKGLLEQAMKYYDRYLKLNDSDAVRVDRALCEFYAGDTEEAINALEKLSKKKADYPLVWANLGMLYEQQGETEKANEAYKKAIETDQKDEYGAKTYANQRLISLNATLSSPADAGDAGSDKVSTSNNETGLTSTLADKSGVGF